MITTNSNGNPLSTAYADAVKADSRSFLAELLVGGTALDCAVQRLEVSKGSCGSTTEYSVGNLISSTLFAEVKELTDNIKGVEVEARIGLDVNGTYEWVTLGFFTISDVKKTIYATTLTGHGRIVSNSGADFSAPTTQSLSQIAYRIGVGLGCTVTLDSGIDGSLEITEPLNGLTNYQALQILASVTGGYAIDTNDGNVKVCLFDDTATHAVDAGMMVALPTVGERDFAITGVQCIVSKASEDEEGEIPAVGYEQGVVNLQMENKYMTQALFNDMAGDLIGYTYRPATIDLSLGDPRIEGNDVLAVTDADGSVYTVPCHVITHTYSGGFHSKIESVRATNSEDDIGTQTPMQIALSEISSGVVSAKSDASKARNIAGTTAQYFWFEGQDADETGAHITEVPQADWKDPTSQGYHSGGNLFARSTGIAVRQGLTELATFGADKAQVGQDGQTHVEIDYHSFKMLDADNPPNTYVWFSDLRGTDGLYNYSFTAVREYGTDEWRQNVDLPLEYADINSVKLTVDGVDYYNTSSNRYETTWDEEEQGGGWVYTNTIIFQTPPASGSTITYTYVDREDISTELTYTTTADGISTEYTISYTAGRVYAVHLYVGSTEYFYMRLSDGLNLSLQDKYFADGTDMTISYPTDDPKAKAFTLGERRAGRNAGAHSYAFGINVTSSGTGAVAIGSNTTASGNYSFAEGSSTYATEYGAHAEGSYTHADGDYSHAEGWQTHASGKGAHAEGYKTYATGSYSHAEGWATTASGRYSHAQNYNTRANHPYQTAMGCYNENKTATALEIGNGTSSTPKNIFEVTWVGNVTARGTVNGHQKRQLLWSGTWNSGSITVDGISDYHSVEITFLNEATHAICFVVLNSSGTSGYVRGSGSFCSATNIYDFIVGLTLTVSTDTLTWVNCVKRNMVIADKAIGSIGTLTISNIIGIE